MTGNLPKRGQGRRTGYTPGSNRSVDMEPFIERSDLHDRKAHLERQDSGDRKPSMQGAV